MLLPIYFSGTNHKSITLGWLERIREKRKKDNTFFAKVCKEAHDLYFATAGKGKASLTGNGSAAHSDLEIEERIGIMSDDDSDDLNEGTSNARDAASMQVAVNGCDGNGGSGNDGDDDAEDNGDGGSGDYSDGGSGDYGDHASDGGSEEEEEGDNEDEDSLSGATAKNSENESDNEDIYVTEEENGNDEAE